MKPILLNAWKLFTRNKGFFYILTVQPIFVFLLMSFLLPYSTQHNIAIIGEDIPQREQVELALESLEGIKLIEVASDEVDGKLMAGNIEIAVILEEDTIVIRSLGDSEVEGIVTLCVEQAFHQAELGDMVTVNDAPKKGLNLSNSLGFMIYKTLASGSALASLLISERKNKMRERILLSRTSVASYLGGLSMVYIFFMMVSSLVYYLTAMVLRFDFGMKNSLGFLLMLCIANIFSTTLFLFVATLFNKEEALWVLGTFILTPMGLFAGTLFPYEFMPTIMQKIGAVFPQRWIIHGIESMQQSGSIGAAMPDMALTLGLSAILFICAVRRSKLLVSS
ncbi:MAG: ABC transporter permease [Eubacteriales bacterium]